MTLEMCFVRTIKNQESELWSRLCVRIMKTVSDSIETQRNFGSNGTALSLKLKIELLELIISNYGRDIFSALHFLNSISFSEATAKNGGPAPL